LLYDLFPIVFDVNLIIHTDFKTREMFKRINSLKDVKKKIGLNTRDYPIIRKNGGFIMSYHQAGYDSYVTGLVFNWFLDFKKIRGKNLSEKNKLFVYRGKPFDFNQRPIIKYFYVEFDPKKFRRNEIEELFQKYGSPKYLPIDDNCCVIMIFDFKIEGYDEILETSKEGVKVECWEMGKKKILNLIKNVLTFFLFNFEYLSSKSFNTSFK
jgi:hypothetical protein